MQVMIESLGSLGSGSTSIPFFLGLQHGSGMRPFSELNSEVPLPIILSSGLSVGLHREVDSRLPLVIHSIRWVRRHLRQVVCFDSQIDTCGPLHFNLSSCCCVSFCRQIYARFPVSLIFDRGNSFGIFNCLRPHLQLVSVIGLWVICLVGLQRKSDTRIPFFFLLSYRSCVCVFCQADPGIPLG